MNSLYKPHYPVLSSNPKVFLQVAIGGVLEPRMMIIELFEDVLPKTVENFRCLCTGERGMGEGGKLLCYRGSPFHRIVEGFMCQGGDLTKHNGTGGESVYGPVFPDESFEGKAGKHVGPGIVSMANSGPDTNSSQFFIVTNATPHLDGKHMVFGQVIEGIDVLSAISKCGTASGVPKKQVMIAECGQLYLFPGVPPHSRTPQECLDVSVPSIVLPGAYMRARTRCGS